MKIPCFHKYFSVNFFICLILISASLILVPYWINCIFGSSIVYSDAIIKYIVYILPIVIIINIFTIVLEYILSKLGKLKRTCVVIKSKIFRLFIYLITMILFLFYSYIMLFLC